MFVIMAEIGMGSGTGVHVGIKCNIGRRQNAYPYRYSKLSINVFGPTVNHAIAQMFVLSGLDFGVLLFISCSINEEDSSS